MKVKRNSELFIDCGAMTFKELRQEIKIGEKLLFFIEKYQ